MNHQILVRILDGRTDLRKAIERGGFGKPAGRTGYGARNQFHHDVVRTGSAEPGIEQADDVRMVELGENLPLLLKARQRGGRGKRGRQNLNRHLFAILSIDAIGLVDDAHAAAPNHRIEPVGAQFGARAGFSQQWPFKKLRIRGLRQQRFHLAAQFGIVAAAGGNKLSPALRRRLERRAHNRIELAKPLGGQDAPPSTPTSSRRNQSFEKAHSRFTVAIEMPTASAVSSMLSPPK